MSAKLINQTLAYDLIARCFLIIIGCIAAWWGIVGFSVFWEQSSTERIASRVIAGEPFKGATLARQLPTIESIERAAYCRPSALRSAAIIRLRMVEVAASANDHKHADEDVKSLGNVIRNSLSCSPADPFLWLVLYWVEGAQNGFKPEYLQMSYDLGPNEGWVALKRNPVAFADYEKLSPDLAMRAINEFLALIKNEFYQQAVDILSGPAWRVRDALLPRLAFLPLRDREGFARIVYNQGLNVSIPGVEPPDSKPRWR
jgi:hypothetical protein